MLVVVAGAVLTSAGMCGPAGTGRPPKEVPMQIMIRSSAMTDGAPIPSKYTCDGQGMSPPLRWTGVPPAAKTLALVVDDPDAPGGTFVHWVVVDFPTSVSALGEGESPTGGQTVRNSSGRAEYFPPCPPSGTHRYRFTIYALATPLHLPTNAALNNALDAIDRAATAQGHLTATYSRTR